MNTRAEAILLTGATGLVGTHLLARLLHSRPDDTIYVLVRDRRRWIEHARGHGFSRSRVSAIEGDLTRPGLGLSGSTRRALERRIGAVVHAAADIVFSRPLHDARRVNAGGTARVLELAERAAGVTRFVHVSTAYVAGRLTGRVFERDNGTTHGFLNGYEQSKYEAEALVRASALPWVILRPSSIVCDGPGGHVSQYNAVHRALRLYHIGLASMMPGEESSPVDAVPADFVAECAATSLRMKDIEGRTFHVCAGDGVISLGRLLDLSYEVWSESVEWKRRAIPRPALSDLETYRLFERSVEESGDARLIAITRSLSHFVPQLALAKRFDTTGTESLVGRATPVVATFWSNLMRYLVNSDWAAGARRAA